MSKPTVNVFNPGGHDQGGTGLNAMAAIAALGNRNEPSNAMLPAVLAMANRGPVDGFGAGGFGGFGAGLVGGVLGGLLFNRRGGFGGDEGGCGTSGNSETRIEDTVFNTATLTKLGSIEAAIPLASAQTENVILQQTNQITNLASQAQLANAAGFAATKDAVQSVGAIILGAVNNVNQNVLEQGCQTRAAVAAAETAILQKLSQDEIDRLRHERDRAERSVEVNALRSQVEVNQTVTSTNAQAQSQNQLQFQLQDIGNNFRHIIERLNRVEQVAHATNSNVIAGNTGAVTTGAQTANPTNVGLAG